MELCDVLESALAFVGPVLRERGIELERDFRHTPSVSGDADRLEQCFLGLFSNALDAMPKGGRLRVTLELDFACRARVTVADTGGGIPEEILPRIFDPFFTTQPGRANGLGLFAAREIVLDHGGAIEVRSTPGYGTELYVTIPCVAFSSREGSIPGVS